MKQYWLINTQFGLIAMAIVLSLQENMDLLILLVKFTIAICTIAIALLLLFWLRLKKIENRIYQKRRQLKSRFNQNITQKIPQKIPQKIFSKPQKTQVYISTASSKLLKKSKKRSGRVRLHWLWAIMIASITGMAIALMQLGNSLISPEYMSIIWLLIGVTLVMSATFIEVA